MRIFHVCAMWCHSPGQIDYYDGVATVPDSFVPNAGGYQTIKRCVWDAMDEPKPSVHTALIVSSLSYLGQYDMPAETNAPSSSSVVVAFPGHHKQ